MVSRIKLKKSAKETVGNNKGLCAVSAAIIIYSIPFITYSVNNLFYLFRRQAHIINYIYWITLLVLSSGFMLSLAHAYISMTGRKETDLQTFFFGFEHIFKAIILNLLVSVFVILWSFLLIVPGIVAFYRYKMAFYILAESPDLAPIDAIRISKKMTNGRKLDLFLFDLSFIGLFLLTYITFGIAGLYVLPYYYSASALIYKELKMDYVDKRSKYEQTNNSGNDYRSDKERFNHTWENNHQ